MSVALYPFQEQAVQALRDNIRRGIRNQVLCVATGGGKTEVALHLLAECYAKGKRGIFTVDRLSLLSQTSLRMDGYGIDHGVIQSQHERFRPWKKIQLASVQTLARRNWPEGLDLFVHDECHGLHKTVLAQVAKREAVSIGLSATPFSRGLGKYYDAVVCVSTTQQLMDDGYLAPFTVFAANEPDMTGAKVTAGEWSDEVAAERSMPIIGDAVTEYLAHGQGKKCVAFGCTVAHIEEMRRQFLAAGVVAECYSYRTPDAEREQMLAEFRKPDSKIRVLLSVAALCRGFDVPDVHVLICARPLRSSFMEWVQMLGRGLRRDPADPSKTCTVLDLSGNAVRFWDAMQEFFRNGISELDDGSVKKSKKAPKKESSAKKCPKCHHVFAKKPACPKCGTPLPKKLISHRAGRLVQVEGGSHPGALQQFYSELVWIARERGYKPGWAANQFRSKTGAWPNGYHDRPALPTQQTLGWVRSRQIAYAKARAKAGLR